MSQNPLPIIYYSNGSFLIFSAEHAIHLRRKRILSKPVTSGAGSSHGLPPYCISPYAAMVAAKQMIAQFKQLKMKRQISLDDNKSEFAARMARSIDREKTLFISDRLNELKRRNIQPQPMARDYSNEFDETKVRLTISAWPDKSLSSHDEFNIDTNEVVSLIKDNMSGNCNTTCVEMDRMHVYLDLHRRGYYISSGIKFGSDFLAYTGDPDDYHSQYAIRVVPGDSTGNVDLTKTDINEINSLQRLTHTANKRPLFTTVTQTIGHTTSSTHNNNDGYNNNDSDTDKRVKYWTLKERVYLNPDSKCTDFDSVEPNSLSFCSTDINYNKLRKTN